MAISLVGSNGAVQPATGTSITPATVAGVAAGDLLICSAAQPRTLSAFTNASYTNWTTLVNVQNSGATLFVQIIYRIADGTASDNPPAMAYGSNTAGSASVSGAYRGVDNVSPFIAQNNQFNGTAGTAIAAPAITNTDAAAWSVFIGTFRGTATPISWTPPTGMTERQDKDAAVATSNNDAMELADSNGVVATGAATYTGTASASAAIGGGFAWAGFLKPATAAGSNPPEPRTVTRVPMFRAAFY